MNTAVSYAEVTHQLQSLLKDVTDEQWTKFVHAMMTGPAYNCVSDSNALGIYELLPRRLADLGLVHMLVRSTSKTGRKIWCGRFKPPLTSDKFLKSPVLQYEAFVHSIQDYDRKMSMGLIDRGQISRSGALAILHRAGPNGFKSKKRFPATQTVFEKAKDIF